MAEAEGVNLGGRPTDYTPEAVDAVCLAMSGGLSLRKSCEAIDLAPSTFLGWAFNQSPFRETVYEQYERARAMRAEILLDELVDIADDADTENVHVARLRCDVRDKSLARLAPKRYADLKKVQHEGGVQISKRIVLNRED